MKKPHYKNTMYACFTGYIVQAVVNNFAPLLFVTFQKTYSIPLSQITLIITINFVIQLLVDLLSAKFVDRIGYRTAVVIAHGCSAAGLILLTVLPDALPNAFAGIVAAVAIYAVGGGLIEVLTSPIIEACPTDNKEKAMSLLHSFYCWGHMGVVLLSTAFFALFGTGNWKILALIWAAVPIINGLFFTKVPLFPLIEDGKTGLTVKQLIKKKTFWILMLMMACAGASEQAVSQWASTFAERKRSRRRQDRGRSCGTDGVRRAYGAFTAYIRQVRRPPQPRQMYDGKRGALHSVVFRHRILSVSCGRADRLRGVRLFRRNYVAGHIQQSLRGN